MDPDAALQALRDLCAEYESGSLTVGVGDLSTMVENLDAHLGAMTAQVQALDAWLTRGGFRPAAWG